MNFHVTFVFIPNYVELPCYILIFNPNENVLRPCWLTILLLADAGEIASRVCPKNK